MIYNQKPQPPPIPLPPDDWLKKVTLLLQNGETMVDIVNKDYIKKYALPYEVIDGGESLDDTLRYTLQPTLCSGDLYLRRFITVDADTLQMKQDVRTVMHTPYPVLVCGDSGVGKELIAKSMIGKRQGKLCAVNCAGFPEQLIESELFGHVKGSFTGANNDKDGLFVAANNGIMFLDEIGELPMHIQAKLLRALQEKSVRPVGGNKDIDINCRFVCATHRDIKKMVSEGTFRRDLYARISTIELDIKPLKERLCDTVPIVKSIRDSDKFLDKYPEPSSYSNLDLSLNVRSLERCIIRYNLFGRI